jgi:myxalamid-type polyketide synthase MxaB
VILGVIRGTAINQDGRTSGITAPNSLSQIECIKSALTRSGLSTSKVDYIEAHGTGTPLGDPIEFQSLTKLFPQRKESDKPVYVTSAKANVGHTETVSGIVGLIKVLLIMKHGVIPGQALLDELNPNINLDGTRLVIPRKSTDLSKEGPFVAGISSFGFGGTNSHVIVESAVTAAPDDTEQSQVERPQHVLAFSAKSKSAAPAVALRLTERLESLTDDALADFCHSANVGRSHFNHRTSIVADSRAAMIESLKKAADGKHDRSTKAGEVRIAVKPKIAFLFTGQGSQYVNMAQDLYQVHPEFRRWIDECNRC